MVQRPVFDNPSAAAAEATSLIWLESASLTRKVSVSRLKHVCDSICHEQVMEIPTFLLQICKGFLSNMTEN